MFKDNLNLSQAAWTLLFSLSPGTLCSWMCLGLFSFLNSWSAGLYPELAGNTLRANTFRMESLDLIETDRLLSKEEGLVAVKDLGPEIRIIEERTLKENPFNYALQFDRPYDASFSFDLDALDTDLDKHYYLMGEVTAGEPRYVMQVNVDHLIRTYSNPTSRNIHNYLLRFWPMYLVLLVALLVWALRHQRVSGKSSTSTTNPTADSSASEATP